MSDREATSFFPAQATGKAKAAQSPWESLGTMDARVGRTLLPALSEAEGSDAFDLDLDSAEDEQDVRSTVEERRFSAAITTRVEQAFQACVKGAPQNSPASAAEGPQRKCGDSRPRLSSGPASSGRYKVPQGPMKIARQFTGGNAQPQSPTASRRDARAHRTATEAWPRTRPTLIPARSIDSHLSKTANGGAAR